MKSIGTGKWHAARSTVLSYGQSLVHAILPQALRDVLPDLASHTLEVITDGPGQRRVVSGIALFR